MVSRGRGSTLALVAALSLAASVSALLEGCSDFDEYPEGDLCENAIRDEEGRAVFFPEARICKRKKPSTRNLDDTDDDAGTDADAG